MCHSLTQYPHATARKMTKTVNAFSKYLGMIWEFVSNSMFIHVCVCFLFSPSKIHLHVSRASARGRHRIHLEILLFNRMRFALFLSSSSSSQFAVRWWYLYFMEMRAHQMQQSALFKLYCLNSFTYIAKLRRLLMKTARDKKIAHSVSEDRRQWQWQTKAKF